MKENLFSIFSGDNLAFLEDNFQKYKKNSGSLDDQWSSLFHFLENGASQRLFITKEKISDKREASPLREMGVQNILNTYRHLGHLAASLDPLRVKSRNRSAIEMKLASISKKELDIKFEALDPAFKIQRLGDIIKLFEKIYCGTIGYEHYYLVNEEERNWIQNEIESYEYNQELPKEIKLKLFNQLVHADYFEKFLAKKYKGKKRFSLEGGETFITLLDAIVEEAGSNGIESLVLGMAHRGRLNVLVNTLKKPASLIFAEFEENFDPTNPDYADVKYHLGYSNYVKTNNDRRVKLSLIFNPSHLEAVNPVVLGSVRARQALARDTKRERVMGILVHGDAAFSGQGVVAESLNLINLENFTTGGSIHIVMNNQIGFTTLPEESRSTLYATDLAKGFQIPIFHVNGDDVEGVLRVVKLAMKYRKKFKKDIIIDLVCYRRLGHSETDEPAFTQPKIYELIKKQKPTVILYEERLLQEDGVAKEEIEEIKEEVKAYLEDSFQKVREENISMKADTLNERWASYAKEEDPEPNTHLLKKQLKKIVDALITLPGSFSLHPRLQKLIDSRKQMFAGKARIDWGFAESLSLGSILERGCNIRFVGQDSIRGTFSHRHAAFVDTMTAKKWFPLNHISENQGYLEIVNSPLSEFSVLGFEYGYSLADPGSMVIWEAQFGDFVNGAQVIIDQFLISSEKKWLRMSGLVLLLPHGYEGQGPEHSSARLERFLHMCAEDNIQVCYPTSPAQFFHLLRRQILRKFRKPLVIMTPKSLLRLPEASSTLDDIMHGKFRHVLLDEVKDRSKIKTLLLMSGKIYYDILKGKEKRGIDHIVIARLEQLYPFPDKKIKEIISLFPNLSRFHWVQEEPENMGAWLFLRNRLNTCLDDKLKLAHTSRPTSASPAAGLAKVHVREQSELVDRALK